MSRVDASRILEEDFDFSMLPLTITTSWIEKLELLRCAATGVEVTVRVRVTVGLGAQGRVPIYPALYLVCFSHQSGSS